MADQDPLIKLDENGHAPVLDYQIPDATSYSGRYYLELALDRSDFIPEASVDRSGQVITSWDRDFVDSLEARVKSLDEAGAEAYLSKLRAAMPELARSSTMDDLSKESILAAHEMGERPVQAIGMLGTVTYRMKPVTAKETSTQPTAQPPVSTGSHPALNLRITITSPARGSRIEGPSTGINVTVRGTASCSAVGRVISVELSTDGGNTTISATPDHRGDWSTWSATIPVRQSGTVNLIATVSGLRTVSPGGEDSNQTSISFEVSLSQAAVGPGGDHTPPTVSVDSPIPGTVFGDIDAAAGQRPLTIQVRGSARDISGIKGIQLIVDGDARFAVDAHPASSGDWSSWTGSVQLSGVGSHQIEVIATDNRNNSVTVPFRVMLAAHEPRRWLYSRFMVVELIRLSNFLGRYGAGRVLKTFSLLPGEKTKISVKSFRRSTETSKRSSSILDHVEDSTTQEFLTTLGSEQTDKQANSDSLDWSVSAKVEQGWGTGRAEVTGRVSGAANSAREEFAKSVTNATQKHAAQKSAVRDLKVNAESESKSESGEEESLEREIQNINTSRTLNFVFRQMNQQFTSVLHLVDIRIAYAAFFQPLSGERVVEYREVPLSQLQSLIDGVIRQERREDVKRSVMGMLQNISDFRDELRSLIEEVQPKKEGVPQPNLSYWRVDPKLVTGIRDPLSSATREIPGIVLASNEIVMRTDGVIVDAILGGGEALDGYARGLQATAVADRQARTNQIVEDVALHALQRKIVEGEEAVKAEILKKVVTPPAPSLTFTLSAEQPKPPSP